MPNAFEKMIADLFLIADFIDFFYDYDTDKMYVCIRYDDTSYDVDYTQFGKTDIADFYLCVKSDQYTPQKNKRIKFNNVDYKIDSFTSDAFGLTYSMRIRKLVEK